MSTVTEDLAALLATIRRPGDFVASGTVEIFAPSLDVEGVGPIALPLLPAQARALAAVAEPAPYGRGPDTLIDPKVRRCRQIGPDRVRIGGRHWPRTLAQILERVTEGLGVEGPITAEFYKLLLYETGSFFVSHRDTEKAPGMFGTLVIALPSSFAGGELVVRHAGREETLALRSDDPAEAAFAAFYADCVHEVLPVTAGDRLILTYSLLRPGKGRVPKPPDYSAEGASLLGLLHQWRAELAADAEVPGKLIHVLEHAYTEAELGFAALKGPDAAIAGVLAAAAPAAGCDLHLALLTIEEHGIADHVDYEPRRRWRDRDDSERLTAGEMLDRYASLSHWQRPDGSASPLGDMPAEEDELALPDGLDALVPDEEHFREASGNEGASYDRTYRRAALVLWPSDRLFAVLAAAGLRATLPQLAAMLDQWEAAGREPASTVRADALALATEMVRAWPEAPAAWADESTEPGEAGRMLGLLARLDDAALIDRFILSVAVPGRTRKSDNAALVAALDRLASARAVAMIERFVAENAGTAFARCANLLARACAAWGPDRAKGLKRAAALLVGVLWERPAVTQPAPGWQRPNTVAPSLVLDLLRGLSAVDETQAGRCVTEILADPARYAPDAVLIPAARQLAADAPRTPAAARLIEACVAHLRERVAQPLAPPADWRRESAIACKCQHCLALATFLRDPGERQWMLRAAEPQRSHVEASIRQAGSDVDTATLRKGSPHTLVCTKNQASHERRVEQRTQDLRDLALLEAGA